MIKQHNFKINFDVVKESVNYQSIQVNDWIIV